MEPRSGVNKCYTCGKEGHYAKSCPSSSYRGSGCFQCGELGHQKRDCPSLRRPSESRVNTSRVTSTSKAPPAEVSAVPFIDTHCHLEYVLERTRHRGNFKSFRSRMGYPENYEGCITTFCDSAALSPSLGMWRELLSEDRVWGTFGLHPHNAKYYNDSLHERLVECLKHERCVALGEIGLDYAPHSESDRDTQKLVLQRQLSLAVTMRKPLVLHCRDAEEDLFELLSASVPSDWKIHLHCFTGKFSMANRFLAAFPNLFIGVTGIVTMTTDYSNVRQTAAEIPLDRLLLETDAPYNVPRNLPGPGGQCRVSHPAFIPHIAKEVAVLRETSVDEVLTAVRQNVKSLYGI